MIASDTRRCILICGRILVKVAVEHSPGWTP
jgi:hypothetical protein